MNDSEDFSNHPLSVAELRSEREDDAKLWKPRDLLIDLLRQIDRGELKTEQLVVCWTVYEGGVLTIQSGNAGCNPLEAVGLLQHCSAEWVASGDG